MTDVTQPPEGENDEPEYRDPGEPTENDERVTEAPEPGADDDESAGENRPE